MASLEPPPPFSDNSEANNNSNHTNDNTSQQTLSQNETTTTETDGMEAPAYSFYSSATGSCFKLQTIGTVILNKKVKYLCGEILDDRYFLLGANCGLEFIDLTLPSEQQTPKQLIDLVRFKQLKIIKSKNNGTLLALAGKNNHVRSYDLNSLRSLIKSKKKSQQLLSLSSSSSLDLPIKNTRSSNMNFLSSNVISEPTNPFYSSSSNITSNNQQSYHQLPQNVSKSSKNQLLSKEYEFQKNLQFQWELDYFKLPNTKMSLSFVSRKGATNNYIAVLTKLNILLFQIDFISDNGSNYNNNRSEFVQIGNYWLPQTPKFLQISMFEVKRSYPFGSRPTSLVEDSNQFQVAQIPSSHKKKPVTSPNINKSPLPSPPSAKGRKNMKNLQLVVPPVRSSISAPNSPQLPPNNSTYSAYSHNRRPSTPLCFYQNKDVANSNAADPMALMSKTENAIGEELPYKEEPIRILDNLYLGSELNAANRSMLNRLNIEFILNVGKEVENPYLDEIVNSNTSDTNTSDTTTSYFDYQHFSSSMLPNPSTPSDDSFKSDIQSPLPQFHEPASSPSALLQSARSAMLSGIPLTVPATSKHNKQIKYKKFFWTHNQENLISDFDSAFAFINEARSAGKSILVHCQCGVSRSASLIIGYVMEANSMNLNQAYEFVKNRSPYISPNMSLVYQLFFA
ncbi:5594_t:CDS:2 [Entrophospora sp. SA101]|nr:5594_t:CDS:2 [Entrophospora sp. SA101]